MKTFTAKQLHDNPSEVYRAAVKEPVKITHKHHGDFIISATEDEVNNEAPCGWDKGGRYSHSENLKLNNHIHGGMDSFD